MPLQDAIANAVESSRVFIEARQQHFEIDVPEAPLYVHADATRLSQVLANLLNNAAKFTPEGGTVRLAVRREGEQAVLVVEDSGIGIPPEMLPRVFEMFTQVDRSLERTQSGLGIGLNISKRLVELHGGTISAHSEGIGRGSSFVVRLPLARAHAGTVLPFPAGGETGRPGGLRILIADDNVDAATSVATLRELMGHRTWTAHDGATAVEIAGQHRPDVILMDIGMPRLNGYDACRAIRACDWGAHVRLIAVTGWGQERDRERSAAAGFDGHLTKPVSPEALEDVLARASAPAA
jgi:CheY-like chemotaxis protein